MYPRKRSILIKKTKNCPQSPEYIFKLDCSLLTHSNSQEEEEQQQQQQKETSSNHCIQPLDAATIYFILGTRVRKQFETSRNL